MTYKFQVLADTESGVVQLRSDLAQSLAEFGSWERFVEVRMGAGPTVRIERADPQPDTFAVKVTWGSAQLGELRIQGQEAAAEGADRLAHTFYEIRSQAQVADD